VRGAALRPKPVVLITGCGRGIGRASAERFAGSGWVVCGVDRDLPPETEALLGVSGGIGFQADVSATARAKEIVEAIAVRQGQVDALVTCAGISEDSSLTRPDEESWDRVLDVDLKGTFNYISAVAPVFRRQRSGKIVTVASTTALRARRGLASYAAAKSGVIGLTRAAARDLGRYGVNVNSVAPGLVLTALAEKIPDETKARLLAETCLERFAEPIDVANVIFFLASDEARHISGEVIRVDGGQLA